jgi:hypothetical protein
MKSGITCEKPNGVLTFFDMFGGVNNYVKNIFSYIEPTNINVSQKIERDTMGHVMFDCGNIFSIRNKSLVVDDHLLFGGKLSYTYSDYLSITDEEISGIFETLRNMFSSDSDLKYFLKFIGSSIDGINSY